MLHDEAVLTFTEAAKALPPLDGRRVHSSTLWRWARRGIRDVRLEVQRLGGRFYTSKEALERFTKALAEVEIPDRPAAATRSGSLRVSFSIARARRPASRFCSSAGNKRSSGICLVGSAPLEHGGTVNA